jgi:hypothetical protein
VGNKPVLYAEKNARRREHKATGTRYLEARRLRRQYGGTFGDPKLCHPFNYNLMVTGTVKEADVRYDKDGDWA